MTRKGVLPGPWHYAVQVKITGKESGPKTHTESSLMGRRRHYSQFKAILWVGVIQMSSWGGWPSLEAESTCHKQIQNVLVLNGEYQRLHLLPPSFMILWHRYSLENRPDWWQLSCSGREGVESKQPPAISEKLRSGLPQGQASWRWGQGPGSRVSTLLKQVRYPRPLRQPTPFRFQLKT